MLPVGAVVAGYRIERVLGTGGMGTVYLAQNPILPRRDALKIPSAELSRNQEFRARFVREADVAARLDHPNIVSIYRRGETDDGQLWIAMQFVDGTDADDALRSGTMTPARAVHVVGEIAKALDYAHRHNVVHRDIKPANFLLSGEGRGVEHALLGDFGIARALDDVGLTATGSVVATVSYAAPEVLAGVRFDHRADVYSLGCALFRMLTGKTPFPAEAGVPAVMLAHLQQQPPRVSERAPGLPAAMDSVIATAMAKDPEHRFQTAGQLAAAASAALHGHSSQHTAPWQAIPSAEVSSYPSTAAAKSWWQPVKITRTSSAHLPPPRRRRRRILATLTAVALLAAGGITAVWMTFPGQHAATQSSTTTPGPASAAPPVPISALNGLLLSADEMDAIMGPKLTPRPVLDGMNASDEMAQKDCAGPYAPAQQIVYEGSGWQAVAQQSFQVVPVTADAPPILAVQAVASFPTADLAANFLDGQKPRWARCSDGKLTITVNSKQLPVSFGRFATTSDSILTITWSPQDGRGWTCARALMVRNNIAIDTDACRFDNPQAAAIDIVHKIAAKIGPQ
ncbi:serine/threonine-protein kinase PknH/PknJ [Mycobacterium sp.]|uniref:serine/threonine-protein kinase PknH/PknJ n=1 Tax=Mycobacterium sp. TaxID=1785 RepID=UPI003D6B7E4B